LKLLIDKDVFVGLAPAELDRLKDQLRSEESSGFFKGAAVTLVQVFRIQSGLGDGLGGVVEEKTAELLNPLPGSGLASCAAIFSGNIYDENGAVEVGFFDLQHTGANRARI
jgi:hypothetical protein